MKKFLFILAIMCLAAGLAFAQTITMTNSAGGYDNGPTVVSVTSAGAPDGSTIQYIEVTTYMGDYIPSWYNMHLNVGGAIYSNVGNLTNAVYNDLNGLSDGWSL